MAKDEVHYFIRRGADGKMVSLERENSRAKVHMGHMGSVRSALDLIADDYTGKRPTHIHIEARNGG